MKTSSLAVLSYLLVSGLAVASQSAEKKERLTEDEFRGFDGAKPD